MPPNDIYTFIVERRRPVRARCACPGGWPYHGLVPAVVLTLSHWLVAANFFNKKRGRGELLLLPVGSPAPRCSRSTSCPARTLAIHDPPFLSFLIVVIGCTVIAHAFRPSCTPTPRLARRPPTPQPSTSWPSASWW